jgi:hydrogenase maturation protease
MDLPRHVDLLDGGTPGLEMVLLLQGYARVIIVDAADMGVAPGEWRRFTPDTAEIKSSEDNLQGTLHSAGLAEALALAGALDLLPSSLVIYGIQPKSLDWSQELTEPLAAALPDVVNKIAEEIG